MSGLLLATGCGPVDYESRASYEPVRGTWERMDLDLTGSRPRERDSGVDCAGSWSWRAAGVDTKLAVRSSRHGWSATEPGASSETKLDAALLRRVVPQLSSKEAAEAMRVFEMACGGPKLGFPAVDSLKQLSATSRYLD